MRKSGLVIAGAFAALALPANAASPPKEIAALKHQVATLRRTVTKLQAANTLLSRLTAEQTRTASAMRGRIAAVDPCPITKPVESMPPGGTSAMHGNGKLWVGLWPSNIVVQDAKSDGSIDTKFGWWRGVAGTLEITGRRIDASAAPATAQVPDGYGDTGFQATGITFPTAGCWEVTGRVGDASLTFVTLVLGA